MRYGSVEALVRWLDREENAAARERRYRNWMRGKPKSMRRFVSATRRVVMDEPGPENLHAKKIMERLKIKRAMYFRQLERVDKNTV
jgi:hypothetical protein